MMNERERLGLRGFAGSACFAFFAVQLFVGSAPAVGQGAGSAAGHLPQLELGGRPAALAGAYAAAVADPDVVFYNPAGLAPLAGAGVAGAYRSHVEGIGAGSVAGGVRLGRLVVGGGVAFLSIDGIEEVEPDPAFGGERGSATGRTLEATETLGRLAASSSVLRPLRLGASVGVLTRDLAGYSSTALLADVGAQLSLANVVLGAALQNLGSVSGDDGAGDFAPPSRLRAGAALRLDAGGGLGAVVLADVVRALEEEATSVHAGLEAGLLPGEGRRLTAVARVGWEAAGDAELLGSLRAGGSIGLGGLAVDYAWGDFGGFGGVHTVGVRWSGGR